MHPLRRRRFGSFVQAQAGRPIRCEVSHRTYKSRWRDAFYFDERDLVVLALLRPLGRVGLRRRFCTFKASVLRLWRLNRFEVHPLGSDLSSKAATHAQEKDRFIYVAVHGDSACSIRTIRFSAHSFGVMFLMDLFIYIDPSLRAFLILSRRVCYAE